MAVVDGVTVQCPAGTLRGVRMEDIDVFTGIPFGQATGGPARFLPPRPAADWKGVLDATRPARIPPQAPSPFFPVLPGEPSEDCLQLNIWTPNTHGPHPVLVWVPGGGNVEGSCAEPMLSGAVFAREGIVAVSFNYRLGALGFLELGSVLGLGYRGSGNNALLDQLLALRWIKRNIAAFGGDPAQITVAGESSSAFSVCNLLASPQNQGLFNRAIVASGGQAVHDIAEADAFANTFVSKLGGADRLLTCTVGDILTAQAEAAAESPLALPFRSVIDPYALPERPVSAIARGSACKVDLLIGWCRDETRLMMPEAAAGDPAFVPPTIGVGRTEMRQAIAAYAQADPGLSPAEAVWKATTAEVFGLPSMRIADAQAGAGAQVYTYRLDYSIPNGPFGDKTPHGLDVPMIFQHLDSILGKVFGLSAEDTPMAATLHAIWSSFIRAGVVEAGLPAWPSYCSDARETMILDRTSRVVTDLDAEDRKVWKDSL